MGEGWRRHGWRYPGLWLAARRLLDNDWYLAHHPDVAESGMAPLRHFLHHGLAEGREPSPRLSLSGYGWRHGRGRWSGDQALLRYWAWGRLCGHAPLPRVSGRGPRGRPRLVVCAHSLGPRLYGAERSLLDVVRGLAALGAEVVVAVPNARHPGYLDALLAHCRAVRVLPYAWWHAERPACAASVEAFRRLLVECRAEGVYLNTLTLEAPALAARALGVPVITHVRELPAHDPALCHALGAEPEAVVARTLRNADLILANSRCTARAFADRGTAVAVVPNTLAMEALTTLALPRPRQGHPLRIGLLGTLVAKKGLADVAAMADALAARGIPAECRLYGESTPELEALLARRAREGAAATLVHCGYVAEPGEALAELDVVVNLSRFQESFGRTVLEAMAAGRPVVAYAWGALPELVAEGCTGRLVPVGDPEAAADCIADLARHPEHLAAMGAAGRERALVHFGQGAFLEALAGALACCFPDLQAKGVAT